MIDTNEGIGCHHKAILQVAPPGSWRPPGFGIREDLWSLYPLRCRHCGCVDAHKLVPPGPHQDFLFMGGRVRIQYGARSASEQTLFLQLSALRQVEASAIAWAVVQAVREKPVSFQELTQIFQACSLLEQNGLPKLGVTTAIEQLNVLSRTKGEQKMVICVLRRPPHISIRNPPNLDWRVLQRFFSLVGLIRHSRFEEATSLRWDSHKQVLWVLR